MARKYYNASYNVTKGTNGVKVCFFYTKFIDGTIPVLNYFVLKTLQVRVRTTPPDGLSSVKKSKPLFRGPVLLKKSEPSLRGEGINTHTLEPDQGPETTHRIFSK